MGTIRTTIRLDDDLCAIWSENFCIAKMGLDDISPTNPVAASLLQQAREAYQTAVETWEEMPKRVGMKRFDAFRAQMGAVSSLTWRAAHAAQFGRDIMGECHG